MGKSELKQDDAAGAVASAVTVTAEEFRRCNPFKECKSLDDLKAKEAQSVAPMTIFNPYSINFQKGMAGLSREEYQIAIAIVEGDLRKLRGLEEHFDNLGYRFNYFYSVDISLHDIDDDRGHYHRPDGIQLCFFDLAIAFDRNEVLEYLVNRAEGSNKVLKYLVDRAEGSNRNCGSGFAWYWAVTNGRWSILENFFESPEMRSRRGKHEKEATLPFYRVPVCTVLLLMIQADRDLSTIMRVLKLLSTDLYRYLSDPHLMDTIRKNPDLRVAFRASYIVKDYKTQAEKAAAILVAHTEKKVNPFLNAAARVLDAMPGSINRLQSDVLRDTNTVRRSEAVARFDTVTPDRIIADVIASIRKEELHTGDYLDCLERYLRVFVFEQDAAVVYADEEASSAKDASAVASEPATETVTTTPVSSGAVPVTSVPIAELVQAPPPASVPVAAESAADDDPFAVLRALQNGDTETAEVIAAARVANSVANKAEVPDGGVAEGDLLGLNKTPNIAEFPEGDLISFTKPVTAPISAPAPIPVTASAAPSAEFLDLFGLASPPSVVPVPAPASAVERDAVPDAKPLALFGLREEATATNGVSTDAGKKAGRVLELAPG